MKFDVLKLVDGDSMEEGVWMQLLSPLDGGPLYRDPEQKTEPCRAKVRHSDCQRMRDFQTQDQADIQAQLQRGRAKDRAEFVKNAARLRAGRQFSVQLVALDNVSSEKPGIVEVEEADAVALYEDPSMAWMVNQVLSFSAGFGNFGIEATRPTKAPAESAGAAPAKRSSRS